MRGMDHGGNSDIASTSRIARLLARVIKGKDARPARFHDQSGQFVGLGAWRNLPGALVSVARFRIAGHRPEQPWISYTAIRRLENLIRPSWKIVEFGSGMSTLWLARRCSQLYSVESDEAWYRIVHAGLAKREVSNVDHRLNQDSDYEDLSAYPDGFFDFALVDGIRRAECCHNVVPKMKPGGWVYLDNSDRAGANPPSGDLAEAKAILMRTAAARGSSEIFVDFVPTSLVVSEGLLVQI